MEPLHRLPPPSSPHSSLRRTRSRPSLPSRPGLPCLAELENRPLSQEECPALKCIVGKAKAKAGKLPVEPWDNLTESGSNNGISATTSHSKPPPPPLPHRSASLGQQPQIAGDFSCKKYAELVNALGLTSDIIISNETREKQLPAIPNTQPNLNLKSHNLNDDKDRRGRYLQQHPIPRRADSLGSFHQ